jgi:hypothetical protein
MRNLSVMTGSAVIRRERLKDALEVEAEIRALVERIGHCENKEAAVFAVLNCVPCILHGENRIGLKLLTRLLVEGVANATKGMTYTAASMNSANTRVDTFIKAVERIVNTEIHGSVESPTQWSVPMTEDGKEVGIICIENGKVRQVIDNIEKLIDIAVVDDIAAVDKTSRKALWLASVIPYRAAMISLRRKEDFEPEEVKLVQVQIDDFYQNWIELQVIAGITNYIHMLGTGHMADYLFQWKNIYRHSQQGWENLNNLVRYGQCPVC